MSNEEVKEEVERVPEEVEKVLKKEAEEVQEVSEKVAEEVQAVTEEVEQKNEEEFVNATKLKCDYTVYRRERAKLKMPVVEKCQKCGKNFKDGDELYTSYIKNDETKQNYLICKKCTK